MIEFYHIGSMLDEAFLRVLVVEYEQRFGIMGDPLYTMVIYVLLP